LTFYSVSKGKNFSLERKERSTELTLDMLNSGEWQKKDFKPVNLLSRGKELVCGVNHPLLKMRQAYRTILLEMGFEEMPTNQFVESSFWNFDSLFQPQQHPARDAHDTFFLSCKS
jgi:phenylalanyl-tRNA synthetase alpha chain